MFKVEELLPTVVVEKLDNLIGDLYSIEAEQYINEVCFGWQYDTERWCS